MTDHDWLSSANIEVATNAIRDEAKKWYKFSDTMDGIRSAMASLTLSPAAFSVLDISSQVTQVDQNGAYGTSQAWLTALFRQASDCFDDFGDALRKTADEYDRTDGQSARTFDQIGKS